MSLFDAAFTLTWQTPKVSMKLIKNTKERWEGQNRNMTQNAHQPIYNTGVWLRENLNVGM